MRRTNENQAGHLERALRALLGLSALLVPVHRRDPWLREWRGEVAHALRRASGARRVRVTVWSLYAVLDALWIRWEVVRMEGWMGSLRIGVRTLARSPGFCVVVLVTLGAGVGANAAVFSLADWAMYRPVPGVESPDELVVATPRTSSEGIALLPHPTVVRLLEGGPGITSVAAYSPIPMDVVLEEGAEPRRVTGQLVTPSFFPTLGVTAWLGRTFDASEGETTDVHAVAVVSHAFWREALDEDPDLQGRGFVVNGTNFRVVGVAPPDFEGPERTGSVSLWVPPAAATAVMPRMPANLLSLERAPIWLQLVARRAGPVPAATLSATLQGSAPTLDEMDVRLHVSERFGTPSWLESRVSDAVRVVGGLVAVLLGLTAANLINLLLSRLARRRHEAVVRRALGASGLQLVREMGAESLVLSAAGTGVAFFVGWGLLHLMDGVRLFSAAPEVPALVPDARTLTFALVAAVSAMGVATVVAALSMGRWSGVDALRGRQETRGPRRLRSAMAVVQIALSLALVVGAGLMARSLGNLGATELGYDVDGVVVFSLNPGVQGLGDEASDRLFRDLLEDVRRLPTVVSAGFTWLEPMSPRRYTEEVLPVGGAEDGSAVTAQANMISPGFVEALGLRMLGGRSFDDREFAEARRPDRGDVVLNRSAAEALFPDVVSPAAVVGREIRMTGRRETAFRVIGVVEDARLGSVQEAPGPYVFDPFGNGYRTTSATFVLRTTGDPAALLADVRDAVRARVDRIPLLEAGTMESKIAGTLSETRTMARIIGIFAALSVVLAGTGLFGLIGESVQARVSEFGVRTALGARTEQVVLSVLGRSLSLAAIGAALGLVAATAFVLLLRSYLFGVKAFDPTTFVGAALVIGVTTVLASLGPALRATRLDPVEALRNE